MTGAPLVAALSLFLAAFSPLKAQCSQAGEAKAAAASLKLASDPYWLTLLHYRGDESLVDDPNFFLSPEGKTDPAAEMNADLDALWEGEPGLTDDEHAACRFPLRYQWIAEKTGLGRERLATFNCSKYKESLAAMSPGSATLVFPGYHANSPSSMFGHTLIRIDHSSGKAMLSYGMNYAAETDPNDSSLAYAYKGLTGGYPGYYSFVPYYEKIQQYSDSEQRDIWEYRLNLTGEETERLAAHAWELKRIYADYYYLDENCSYQILFLLEAARPGVDLTSRFPLWVTPVDTVRAVIDEGLVSGQSYRPSAAWRIRALGDELTRDQARLAVRLSRGETGPDEVGALAPRERARSLEIAAELSKIDFAKDRIEADVYRQRYHTLLSARAKLAGEPYAEPAQPALTPPHLGHPTSRIEAGVEGGRDGGALTLGWRPAYHDLGDPLKGNFPGSQISFTEVVGAFDPLDGAARLRKFDLIAITSLSPVDRFFSPWSWKVRFGGERRGLEESGEGLVWLGEAGGGKAASPADWLILYGLAKAEAAVEEGEGKLRAGVEAGALATPLPWLTLGAGGAYLLPAEKDASPAMHEVKAFAAFAAQGPASLRVTALERGFGERSQKTVAISWYWYY